MILLRKQRILVLDIKIFQSTSLPSIRITMTRYSIKKLFNFVRKLEKKTPYGKYPAELIRSKDMINANMKSVCKKIIILPLLQLLSLSQETFLI